MAVCPLPTAILAEAKLGGEANQLVGPAWTLTVGCAVLVMVLRPTMRHVAAGAIACCIVLAGLDPFSGAFPDHLGVPDLQQTVTWHSVEPFVLAPVSKGKAVYDETYPSLSVSPASPAYPAGDINDILAAGYTPRWFVDNLLSGRYALVSPVTEWLPGYDSDLGRYDESVPWKLNLLLHMGYAPVTDPDTGTVLYRPTARLRSLGWFARCFGPYQAGDGVMVRLRGPGGLACIDGDALHLRSSYWPTTDFVVTLRNGAGVDLRFAASPHTLKVTPLDSEDHASSPASDLGRPGSALGQCLTRAGAGSVLAIRTAHGAHNARCRVEGGSPVLEIPSPGDGAWAHVAIQVAAGDAPRITAVNGSGSPVRFTLLNPTPSDVKNL